LTFLTFDFWKSHLKAKKSRYFLMILLMRDGEGTRDCQLRRRQCTRVVADGGR
jgi:hypothetical protein